MRKFMQILLLLAVIAASVLAWVFIPSHETIGQKRLSKHSTTTTASLDIESTQPIRMLVTDSGTSYWQRARALKSKSRFWSLRISLFAWNKRVITPYLWPSMAVSTNTTTICGYQNRMESCSTFWSAQLPTTCAKKREHYYPLPPHTQKKQSPACTAGLLR